MVSSRDIFALPGELSRAILASTGANEGNAVLNRMALVGRLWHNALAPPAGACMPALTRCVTLGERDMLAVAQIARPWWRWVEGRESVAPAGLASLAAGCTAITTLDLSCCCNIGDTALKNLAAGCTAITTLDLSYCNIGDTALENLAAGCTAITTLDLSYCHGIGDAGLASLAAGCTAITTLNLRYCHRITDTGLASLCAGCPAITGLDLRHCRQITDTGLASLANLNLTMLVAPLSPISTSLPAIIPRT